MITTVALIVLIILIFVSILDLKYKAVPSVVLTGTILMLLILRPENIIFGAIGFVFAIFIRDLTDNVAGSEFGVADVKVLTIMGLLLSNFNGLMLMIAVYVIFQFVYVAVWRWRSPHEDLIPFLPCLLSVYIVLLITGMVA